MLVCEGILKEKHIFYRLIGLSDKGVSFDDVLRYAKGPINPKEICKTIVVKNKQNIYYGFFLKGDQKLDFSKVKALIGKASIVSYEDLKQKTGKEPGAICPFLLGFPVLVDKHVFDTELINFGSGDHHFGLEIHSKDLYNLFDFTVVDVALA